MGLFAGLVGTDDVAPGASDPPTIPSPEEPKKEGRSKQALLAKERRQKALHKIYLETMNFFASALLCYFACCDVLLLTPVVMGPQLQGSPSLRRTPPSSRRASMWMLTSCVL
jgi:hypothetical protein